MIDYKFIEKVREQKNIPEELIERDYAIELLLSYLGQEKFFQKYLVFRGGTALKKVYFPDFRYSEDIDFVTGFISRLSILAEKFGQILAMIAEKFQITLKQKILFPQKGHLQLLISYDIVGEIRLEKIIKVDIVEDNFILPYRRLPLKLSFEDFTGIKASLNTYILESIIVEKIGRILDVVDEPRDLWDLLYLLKSKIKIPTVKNIFIRKYGSEIYLPNLLEGIKKQNYKKNWDIRLKNQLPEPTEYSKIIVDLETLIKKKFKP